MQSIYNKLSQHCIKARSLHAHGK